MCRKVELLLGSELEWFVKKNTIPKEIKKKYAMKLSPYLTRKKSKRPVGDMFRDTVFGSEV